MKRLFILFAAACLLGCLCACKAESPEPPAATPAPEISTPAPAPAATPSLSAGAADNSRLSGRFQVQDGAVYTTLLRGEGIVCLYDSLPEDAGSVAGFFITGSGAYVSLKDYYYSLEPATLYFFPADGSAGKPVAENLLPGGLFCLAGAGIFYENYEDETLWRLDAATGQTQCVLAQPVRLLAADGGFIYYVRDGSIYRNDSTMTAETLLFEDPSISYLFADETRLCALTFNGSDASVVQLRQPDGTLCTELVLDEVTDNILCHAGRVYVPQQGAKTVLVYDFDGNALGSLPLAEADGYVLLRCVTGDALYYETMQGESAVIYRVDLQTGAAQDLGEIIQR